MTPTFSTKCKLRKYFRIGLEKKKVRALQMIQDVTISISASAVVGRIPVPTIKILPVIMSEEEKVAVVEV